MLKISFTKTDTQEYLTYRLFGVSLSTPITPCTTGFMLFFGSLSIVFGFRELADCFDFSTFGLTVYGKGVFNFDLQWFHCILVRDVTFRLDESTQRFTES